MAVIPFSSEVLHKKVMLIYVSSWNGPYKPLFAWEDSPELLSPSTSEFIFINPLVEGAAGWPGTRVGPFAEAFKPK